MEILPITGLHVEAEPTEVLGLQPKQPLTSVGGHLDTRGVSGLLPLQERFGCLPLLLTSLGLQWTSENRACLSVQA